MTSFDKNTIERPKYRDLSLILAQQGTPDSDNSNNANLLSMVVLINLL